MAQTETVYVIRRKSDGAFMSEGSFTYNLQEAEYFDIVRARAFLHQAWPVDGYERRPLTLTLGDAIK